MNPPLDITARIVQLAAQGLRVRDISALLNIHPIIVLRVLQRPAAIT